MQERERFFFTFCYFFVVLSEKLPLPDDMRRRDGGGGAAGVCTPNGEVVLRGSEWVLRGTNRGCTMRGCKKMHFFCIFLQ